MLQNDKNKNHRMKNKTKTQTDRQAERQAGGETDRQTSGQKGVNLKFLYGVMRVNECFPVDLTDATLRGTEKEATPSWKLSLLG